MLRRAEKFAARGKLGFHLIASLNSNLFQARLVVAGLVVEHDAESPNSFAGRIEQNQFILEVVALLADLEIALPGANAAHIIFVTDLADAPEVRSNDQVLMPGRR